MIALNPPGTLARATGDLAFLLSLLGLATASSTFGNPWLAGINEKGERQDVDSDGKLNWRTRLSLYLMKHIPPPGHDF